MTIRSQNPYIDPVSIGDNDYYPVSSEAAMLALPAEKGDVAVRDDFSPDRTYQLILNDPTDIANWKWIASIQANPVAHTHDSTGDEGVKLVQANTHETPDTDSAAGSLHHTVGTTATQACSGTDSRLSDDRTPLSHSSSKHDSTVPTTIQLDLKAAKVIGGTTGNLTGLSAGGDLVDSGSKVADFDAAGTGQGVMDTHELAFAHGDIAHTNRTALNLVSNTNTGDQDLSGLAALAVPGAAGNLAGLTALGDLQDTGSKVADFAVTAKGVTDGDSHDHTAGAGAQIAYGGLSGLPTLGTAAAEDVGTFEAAANDAADALTAMGVEGDGNAYNHAKYTNAEAVTAAKTVKLNEFAAPDGGVALGAQKITGLADPAADQDAATRAYVLANAGGQEPYDVIVASGDDLSTALTGLSDGDNVLVEYATFDESAAAFEVTANDITITWVNPSVQVGGNNSLVFSGDRVTFIGRVKFHNDDALWYRPFQSTGDDFNGAAALIVCDHQNLNQDPGTNGRAWAYFSGARAIANVHIPACSFKNNSGVTNMVLVASVPARVNAVIEGATGETADAVYGYTAIGDYKSGWVIVNNITTTAGSAGTGILINGGSDYSSIAGVSRGCDAANLTDSGTGNKTGEVAV